MSKYVDIMVISEEKEKENPFITEEEICELLEHKHRFIRGVQSVPLEKRSFGEILGNYCHLHEGNVIFQMEHYNKVMLPLWHDFITTVRNFSFLDFTSEEGVKKIRTENDFSPNIIYYEPEEGFYGYSLEDFFRSDKFVASKPYTLHGVYAHHE